MKLPQGKVPSELLREIFGKWEKRNSRVLIGPRVGFDSAVLEMGEKYLVVSNDPSGFLPESIPIEYFAFGTVHWAASDVAVFGANPKWMVYTIIFPVGVEDEFVKRTLSEIEIEAKNLNMSIIGGHSGVYKIVKTTLSSSTVFGEVEREKLVTPAGAKDGDLILMTKELGLEIAIALVYEREKELEELIGYREVRNLKRRYRELSTVREALLLSKNGLVHAMHDVTEGGLATAINEIADSSNLGFTVKAEEFEISPVCKKIINHYSIDLLNVSNTGSLLAAVPPDYGDEAISLLKKRGIRARIIGKFQEGGRFLVENGKKKIFPKPTRDAYASIFE